MSGPATPASVFPARRVCPRRASVRELDARRGTYLARLTKPRSVGRISNVDCSRRSYPWKITPARRRTEPSTELAQEDLTLAPCAPRVDPLPRVAFRFAAGQRRFPMRSSGNHFWHPPSDHPRVAKHAPEAPALC